MIKRITKSIILMTFLLQCSISGYAQSFEVTAPESVAAGYDIGIALFGVPLTSACADFDLTGNLAAATQAGGETTACATGGDITSDVDGKVAVLDRGDCNFTEKVLNAQNAGAIAVVVCNSEAGEADNMAGESDDITIAAVMLSQGDCMTLRALPEFADGTIEVRIRDNSGQVPSDDFGDEVALWESTFDGSLGDWTSTSISCGASASDNASWDWVTVDNFDRGGFSAGARLFSFSPCDGAAIFDSDFLDNGGDQANQGGGPCPAVQEASLTSPAIDLSGFTFTGVPLLKFTNIYRQFDSQYFVEWSTDGGMSWTEKQINGEAEANSDHITNVQRVILSGVDPAGSVMIRFRIIGDYYYWGVDDVKIVDFSGINARIFNTFYTPLSYAVPQSHADADTFFFVSSVINESAVALSSVKMDVEIINDATENVVYTNSATVTDVAPQDTVAIAVDELFVPNALGIGVYRIEYNLSLLDQSEDSNSDNSETFFFEITDNTFAKENGPTTAFNPGLDDDWSIGALYKLSPNVETEASSVTIMVESQGDILTDNYVDVYLLQLNGGVYPTFNDFDFDETDIFNHPSFTLINQTTHIFTDELPGDLITIPLLPDGETIPLVTGAPYIVLVGFDTAQQGQALVPNNELFMGYSEDILSLGISDFIVDGSGGGWFTGFEGDPAPVVRLNIGMTSSADEIALPEGSFTVQPNPANHTIQANLEFENRTDAQIIVANIEGRILFMKNLTDVISTTEDLNVSQLPNGTYMIRVSTAEGTKTQKIVVQH